MNKQELIPVLKEAFYKVFNNSDPFGRMFNNTIKHKIILCPTDGYYLSEKQFYVLMKASKALGETSFYLSEIEDCFLENMDEQNDYSFGHGELSNDISYEKYKKLRIVLENALYSINCCWGVIISHEDHAVAGGTDYFIESFKKNYPDWNQGYKNFVEMCESKKKQYNSDLAWLPGFLDYINSV